MMAGNEQFEAALRIIETLRAEGHEAYLAGGCVRDLLLGREPADYDAATSATPDVVLDLFPRTFAVGAHFGVVLVGTCGAADLSEQSRAEGENAAKPIEVATFRSDLAYSDGRHPDAVRYTKTAEEDVRRRDFTINGLLLDPLRLFPEETVDGSHPSRKDKDAAKVGHPVLEERFSDCA
jgi:poly(A) polymerase